MGNSIKKPNFENAGLDNCQTMLTESSYKSESKLTATQKPIYSKSTQPKEKSEVYIKNNGSYYSKNYLKVNQRIYTPQKIKYLVNEIISLKLDERFHSNLELPLANSNKLTIVFDLNGLLVYRKKLKVVPRPHLEPLIEYCLNNFNVIVWSSATQQTIDKALGVVFPNQFNQLTRVYTRKDVIPLGDPKQKVMTLKDLSVLWADLNFEHMQNHEEILPFGGANTLIIDDSKDKCKNQLANLIQPKAYEEIDLNDNELIKLLQYLKTINNTYSKEKDIRDIIRNINYDQFKPDLSNIAIILEKDEL